MGQHTRASVLAFIIFLRFSAIPTRGILLKAVDDLGASLDYLILIHRVAILNLDNELRILNIYCLLPDMAIGSIFYMEVRPLLRDDCVAALVVDF